MNYIYMNFENKRDTIIHELQAMSQKEIIQKNFFKVRAYRKVIDQISKIETVTSIDDLRNVDGIGVKIRQKIEEILQTGQLRAAERAREIPNIQIYNDLMKIHGIGIVKATELVEIHNIKSIDDLIKKTKTKPELLNEKQYIGLQYYLDLELRVPKTEIDKHTKFLRTVAKKINSHIEIKMVGSYRRGATDSGDIDVIFTVNKLQRLTKIHKKTSQKGGNNTEHQELFKQFINKLKEQKYLVADLGSGNKKYMGICKLKSKSQSYARRIDILYTSPIEFPFAMLYFTGDFDINVELRKRAQELGYKLNEYGLQNLSNKEYLKLSSEREIFSFLGYKFLQPKVRNINNLVRLKS